VPNRLASESSLYLRQHADNPVDWYPWGEEAFAEARRRDCPILLSVGYSSCHWCHVMERESFADERVAARLNSHFVNVKVDREERPDVDEVYMRAVQAFNDGRGGWPMTVFLAPDGRPFFGGTYFPPVRRDSAPGLLDVIAHVVDAWRKRRDDVTRVGEELLRVLDQTGQLPQKAPVLGRDWLDTVAVAADEAEDEEHGGFGERPKFPPHGTLAALVAHVAATRDPRSQGVLVRCLEGMARGGVHDLLDGGFHRYSVDAEWRIPHFEKMLYDQAQLVPAYVDGWRLTGDAAFAAVAAETLSYVDRRLSVPGGLFASSTDADDAGGEGFFYTWTPAELAAVLGEGDGARLAALLEVTAEGTFEGTGRSVLRAKVPPRAWRAPDRELWERARPLLLAARDRRAPPQRDDKVVVAWNALMVSAFAAGARLPDGARWGARAVAALEALVGRAVVDGRLMRVVTDDGARVPGFADDHANLLQACLDVFELTQDGAWLDRAEALADVLVDTFLDPADGGFWLVGRDRDAPLVRSKQGLGGAEPGATGVGALSFVRLGHLLGRRDLLDHADAIARSVQAWLARAPRVLGAEAVAAAWLAQGGVEVAVVGDPADPRTAALWQVVQRRPLPFAVAVRAASPAGLPRVPWLAERAVTEPTAFVCEGHTCRLPTRDPGELSAQLEAALARRPAAAPPEHVRVHAPELPDDVSAWIGTDVPLTLERLRGHVVILDFFTYCCINCLHVLPELAAVEERFAGQPVVVIGVHCAKFPTESQKESVERALQRHGVRHPVVHDPVHAIWEEYAVRSWPTVVVVDPTGRIALQQPGEIGRAELGDLVAALLAEGRAADTLRPPVPVPHVPRDDGATLRFPGKVHVWPDALHQEMGVEPWGGRVYVADTGHHRVLEYAVGRGPDGWPRLGAPRAFGTGAPGMTDGVDGTFREPQGIRRHEGTLYVADTGNHALRAVDLATGAITTLAGTGRKGTRAPTREALAHPRTVDLRSPWDVEVMAHRDTLLVFLAMAGQHQIWVYGAGHLGILAGSGREDHVDGPAAAGALAQPSALSLLGRYLLFADAETSSIRALDLQSHQLLTVVGRGLFDFGDKDGPASEARLQHPLGVTLLGDEVLVADTFNHKLRAIGLTDGTTRTVAGGAGALAEPGGVARLGAFALVADTNHHVVRAVHLESGEIRTLA
jgi:uncharacterized protein YyaL (SSP411 family)/thiol-disulfide isomerase/thioredoxin